jgi:predicted transcriptional regulator
MPEVLIELDPDQKRRLEAVAASQRRSEQEVCRDAVIELLERLPAEAPADRAAGFAALRGIIGLAGESGRENGSVYHDIRPGEED